MLTRRSAIALAGVGGLSLLYATLLPGCVTAWGEAAAQADSGGGSGSGQGGAGSGQNGAGGQGGGQNGAGSGQGTSDNQSDPAAAELQTFSAFLFDTYIEVKAVCEPQILDTLSQRLTFFENKLSRTRQGSDVYRVNAAGGSPVEVCAETAAIIGQALDFCASSGGLFDITIGAASSLWDFKQGTVPDAAALAEAVKHIDYRLVGLRGNTVQLADPAAALDLGGVAKGAIADDAVRLLREAGVTSALINLGGNVYALGSKPGGELWSVGIQSPFAGRGTLLATLPARDISVVTSGPYERGFQANGRFYHHILDPKTGYPVQTDLAGVTIISASSTEGDLLSTTSFLLGQQAAAEMLSASPGIQAVLTNSQGETELLGGAKAELL